MLEHFAFAIDNATRYGDTDVFPFPFENHIFFDHKTETIDLLQKLHSNFNEWISRYPPANETAFVPINYVGFRWATQIDPFWNLYFLALVSSIAPAIESVRISPAHSCVFSYRYKRSDVTAELFSRDWGWFQFMEKSVEIAKKNQFIVVCDIADFYARINHHRLENALAQLKLGNDIPSRILKFLLNFSNTYSFGLPVGGPAARLLSELVLNQIDHLLLQHGITFCRFADDYHLFVPSLEKAYADLVFLSEKLYANQGLSLQKSKTRIMRTAEFLATSPIKVADAVDSSDTEESKSRAADGSDPPNGPVGQMHDLMHLSLRFDPYSATAQEDYDALKAQLSQFDVLGLLRSELGKTRIHSALAKKIVSAIRFLSEKQKNDAILTLIGNSELLYPIWPSIMNLARTIFDELSDETRVKIAKTLYGLLQQKSHVLRPDLNLAYTVRLLATIQLPQSQDMFAQIYEERTSALVRRDIIVAMARF